MEVYGSLGGDGWVVGAEVGGGGPVLCASLGSGCLLASHCIVLLHHYLDALHDCPPMLWAGPSEEVHKIRRQQRSRRTRRTTRQPGAEAEAYEAGVCRPCSIRSL